MGFPLSTDIFGQLKWLVKQVKLLVFRVTRIEQGGGAGAQNINQVLTTGATATDKSLLFNSATSTRALTINENFISILNPEDSYTAVYAAGVIELNGAYRGIISTDNGLSITGILPAGGASSKLSVYPTSLMYQDTSVVPGNIALALDLVNNIYTLGDTSNLSCLYIDATNNSFRLGDFNTDIKGLDMNIGPTVGQYFLGNQNGTYFNVYDNGKDSFIVTSFLNGGESGLGLFNYLGQYLLGDFGGTAQPNTYNVYLDVISNKTNASIKSYYNGKNNGLYIDYINGIYGFRNEQNNDIHFGININTPSAPALDISNEFMAGGTFATPAGNLRVLINGTPFYIELWQ